MSYKNAFEEIYSDLEEIKKLIAKYEAQSGDVPQIEIDLALSRMRNAYEVLTMMSRSVQENIIPAEPENEPGPEEIKETRQKAEPPSEAEEKEPEPQDAGHQTSPEPEFEVEKPQNGDKAKKEHKKIFADRFEAPQNQINEKIGKNQKANDLASKLKAKPIKDIHTAIGVNDRFLFTKELFNGNKEKYREVVDTVNNASGYDEAMEYINYEFDWDTDNPYVQLFLDIVKRKHS